LSGIDGINNVESLQAYLAKKGHSHTPNVSAKPLNTTGYSGLQNQKLQKEKAKDTLSVAPTEASVTKKPEPYVPSSVAKPQAPSVNDMVEGVRNVTTELDYKNKVATRHIVEKD